MSEYLANSVYGYGFGYGDTEALARMATHMQNAGGDVEVMLVQYPTDTGVTVGPGGYRLHDDVEPESEQTFVIDAGDLGSIAAKSNELEMLVEEVLVEAEEVDGDE